MPFSPPARPAGRCLLASERTPRKFSVVMPTGKNHDPDRIRHFCNQALHSQRTVEPLRVGSATAPRIALVTSARHVEQPQAMPIEAAGFQKGMQTGIVLQVNQSYRADFQLQVNASDQTVEVSAAIMQVESHST